MSPLITALLLATAIIHAGWNAVLRSGEDRLWSISVMALVGAIVAIPFALAFAPPARASWPYLAGSSTLQIGYTLFLIRAYRDGHLAHVYPIARGSAPLLITMGAAIFANELPAAIALCGIGLVSFGIVVLTLGQNRPDAASVASALAAGGFIASYMVVDGLGVRVAGSATGYAAWQAVVAGFLIPLAYVSIRRQIPRLPRDRHGMLVSIAGILGTAGYCTVVWAMSRSTMGGVSAVRETSILFAALIGTFVLRERMTFQKVIGAITVTMGVVFLSLH